MHLIFSHLLFLCFGKLEYILKYCRSFLHVMPLRKGLFFYAYKLSFPYDVIYYFLVFISLESEPRILTNLGQHECTNIKEKAVEKSY